MSDTSVFQRLFGVCVLTGLGAVGYFWGSGRYDYAAHFLAGAGGTLMIVSASEACWPLLKRLWPSAPGGVYIPVGAATVASIILGVLAEFAVFAAPVADILDIVHQSLGAVVVGFVYIVVSGQYSTSVRVFLSHALAVVLGLGMIVVGAKLVGII